MIHNLFLELLVIYEIWILSKFNFFFKLRCLQTDYHDALLTKIKSVAFKESFKIAWLDLFFLIIIIGIFSLNMYFCIGLLTLTIIQSIIFKLITNKMIRKISFIIIKIISITLLVLSIINNYFFNIKDIQLIKHFLNI